MDDFREILNFNRSFLKHNQFICKERLVLPIQCSSPIGPTQKVVGSRSWSYISRNEPTISSDLNLQPVSS